MNNERLEMRVGTETVYIVRCVCLHVLTHSCLCLCFVVRDFVNFYISICDTVYEHVYVYIEYRYAYITYTLIHRLANKHTYMHACTVVTVVLNDIIPLLITTNSSMNCSHCLIVQMPCATPLLHYGFHDRSSPSLGFLC